MSGPPKRKPDAPTGNHADIPTFPDPDGHESLRVLRREIRRAILKIQGTLPRGEDRRILVEFVSVLHPGAFHDPGRLPYESQTGRSRKKRHESCLLAFVSKLIQDYWWLVLDEKEQSERPHATVEAVQAKLDQLKRFAEKGIRRCQIVGDESRGFELTC